MCKTKSTAVSEDALAWPSAVQARSNPAYSTSTCASGDCELACKREFVTTFFLFSLWCPSHRVLLFCVGTGPTFGDNLQFAMIASARPFQARASGVRTKVHPLTRQVSLPGRSRLGSTFRSASSRLSKSAPRKRPIGFLCEQVDATWRPHLIFLESRLEACWQQEVWPRHENKSRERCGSGASSPHLRFFHGVACFFSPLSGSGYSGRRWPMLPIVARSERALSLRTCPPVKAMELTYRLTTSHVQAIKQSRPDHHAS